MEYVGNRVYLVLLVPYLRTREREPKFATAEHPATVADFDELRDMGAGFDLLVELNELFEAGYVKPEGRVDGNIRSIVLTEAGERELAVANAHRDYGNVVDDETDSD